MCWKGHGRWNFRQTGSHTPPRSTHTHALPPTPPPPTHNHSPTSIWSVKISCSILNNRLVTQVVGPFHSGTAAFLIALFRMMAASIYMELVSWSDVWKTQTCQATQVGCSAIFPSISSKHAKHSACRKSFLLNALLGDTKVSWCSVMLLSSVLLINMRPSKWPSLQILQWHCCMICMLFTFII